MSGTGEMAALTAYLNAALRESCLDAAHLDGDRLVFRDDRGRSVSVGVRSRSSFRLLFCEPVTIDGCRTEVETLLSKLAAAGGATFRHRVLDSLANSRAAPPGAGNPERWTFVEAEQALKFGHPHHPNPRSRDEMPLTDARIYAPEHGGSFPLFWIGADPERLELSEGAPARFAALAQADRAPDPGRRIAIPWHPWQAERLRARKDVARLEAAGGFAVLGPGRGTWSATASMRCVHGWHAPAMLKISLSLRLTNSLRDLSAREVLRGVQISVLLASPIGGEIRAAFPRLVILAEPGFAALRDEAGAPIASSLVVLRDNPFRDPAAPGPVMLASLCEPGEGGRSPLGRIVLRLAARAPAHPVARAWFRRFLDEAILPILELRARWGLLFGAHQQNLMLVLRDGWPAGAMVRDCQGTGHLTDFHDTLVRVCPGLGEGAENIVDAALGDGLLTYYVIVNSVLNTLATLVLDGLAPEESLIEEWRDFLRASHASTPGDPTLYERLLNDRDLTCKANFATSRSGVNEADGDARGQRAAFIALPNPAHVKEPV